MIIFQLVCVQRISTKDSRDIPPPLMGPRVILSFHYMLQIVFLIIKRRIT